MTEELPGVPVPAAYNQLPPAHTPTLIPLCLPHCLTSTSMLMTKGVIDENSVAPFCLLSRLMSELLTSSIHCFIYIELLTVVP